MRPEEQRFQPDAQSGHDLPSRHVPQLDLKEFSNNPNTCSVLSTALRREIASDPSWNRRPDRVVSEASYLAIEEQVLAEIAELGHPYHNEEHTRGVVERAIKLGNDANLSSADKQLLRIAALFHDYGHAGNTYRQTVAGVERNDISNEEFAAIKADEFVGQYLSPAQRLRLQGMILATSFGQNNPDSIPDPSCYREYTPHSDLEKLLAFADVNSLLCDFDTWMTKQLAVLSERGRAGIPIDFDNFVATRLGFLDYVQYKLDDVKPLIDAYSAKTFQRLLDARHFEVSTMIDKNSPHAIRYSAVFTETRDRRLAELN